MMKTTILILAMAGAAAAQESSGEVDRRKQEILNKLNSMRISTDFKDVPLNQALDYLRDFSGLNLVIDAEAHAKLTEEQLKVTLKVNELLLKSVLKLMLSARDLTAVYREGVLLIVPRDKADRSVSLQIYDVRDLLTKIQDFPGPRVELVSPSATGQGPLTGATFTLEEPKSIITEDFLTEMIKTNTGDKSWDENPGASMQLVNGRLVVSQSKRVHEEIARLVNMLRQFQ